MEQTQRGESPRESDATSGERGEEPTEPESEPVTFGLSGLRAGFLTCVPIAFGVAGYGVAFGVLASQAGLSVAEATLMSATVFAGAAQIIAVELWTEPIPIAALVVTTFAVNLRYSLMGAALQPWLGRLSPTKIYSSLCLMADENWALTMREFRAGNGRGAFLLGSGIALWLFWVVSTILGTVAGGSVGDPNRYGVDFILVAVFVALVVELWDGRSTLAPWIVALATSVVAAELLSGQWYILLGGLTAALLEVIRHDG
ncbi:AzlC family ABC transporter permease [Natronorubrum sulfidifaciens]|uniref:AzlC family protein n=1 Tax=Natronorubrum sulfidifaciens JCM 14089 TaxID=1230460 RepID=L9W438_9EURY|nr:AzlC family ABC transporter permease [Natronorubrum sulfidifaciens]ELY44254.1 AzlC family protein [Natronorubrum sulfidifaciens JCM 14089]